MICSCDGLMHQHVRPQGFMYSGKIMALKRETLLVETVAAIREHFEMRKSTFGK